MSPPGVRNLLASSNNSPEEPWGPTNNMRQQWQNIRKNRRAPLIKSTTTRTDNKHQITGIETTLSAKYFYGCSISSHVPPFVPDSPLIPSISPHFPHMCKECKELMSQDSELLTLVDAPLPRSLRFWWPAYQNGSIRTATTTGGGSHWTPVVLHGNQPSCTPPQLLPIGHISPDLKMCLYLS